MMINAQIQILDVSNVGRNSQYCFGVGRVGDRWLGFAASVRNVFFMADVGDGFRLGVADRELAIRMVGAIAHDPESGFGGIDEWQVPEHLRGKPGDFECPTCGAVCCQSDHRLDN